MENTASWISIVADICGILAFIISIVVAGKVYNINKQINNKDKNKVTVKDSKIGGDFVGRDKNS